jgi:hypothetical protein
MLFSQPEKLKSTNEKIMEKKDNVLRMAHTL